MIELEENIWIFFFGFNDFEVYVGFEFDQIKKDFFGNVCIVNNFIGVVVNSIK